MWVGIRRVSGHIRRASVCGNRIMAAYNDNWICNHEGNMDITWDITMFSMAAVCRWPPRLNIQIPGDSEGGGAWDFILDMSNIYLFLDCRIHGNR